MSSKTDVCNLALLRIGISQQLTNVDTDGTADALSCLVVFNVERDFVLRDFAWPRARAYATLNLATNFPVPVNADWQNAYRMPADALFIRRIVTTAGRLETNPPAFAIGRDPAFAAAAAWNGGTAYVIGNMVLLSGVVYECILANTNHTPPNATYWRVVPNDQVVFSTGNANFEYTAQLTDPTQWEAEFISMLAWRLAASLSLAKSRTQDMAKTCLEMYAAEKKEAEARAALEAQKDTTVTADTNVQALTNHALLRLGLTKDTQPKSSGELMAEAQVAYTALQRARDFVIRDFPWPWARAYADPVLFAGDPNAPFSKDWIFAYTYPADASFIRRIVNPLERADFRRKRQYQWGGDAMWPVPYTVVAGSFGTIAIAQTNVVNNDTVTIDSEVYTFKTVLTGAAAEILIGADSGSTALHLAEALNGGPNEGTDFGANTGANGSVLAVVDGSITSPPATTTVNGSILTISGLSGTSYLWSTTSSAITLTPQAGLSGQNTQLILTNEPSISIEYTRKLTTLGEFEQYDPVFSSMLVWRFAFELAPSRIPDPKVSLQRLQMALAMYEREKTQAQAAALREAQQQEPLEAEWIRGR